MLDLLFSGDLSKPKMSSHIVCLFRVSSYLCCVGVTCELPTTLWDTWDTSLQLWRTWEPSLFGSLLLLWLSFILDSTLRNRSKFRP